MCALVIFFCVGIMAMTIALAEILRLDKSSVRTTKLHELCVGPLLNDLTLGHDDNIVDITDGRKSMGDDNHRAALGDVVECFLDDLLSVGIKSARGFVQQQDPRIGNDAAGNDNSLLLTS
jgi:hypothetical protein